MKYDLSFTYSFSNRTLVTFLGIFLMLYSALVSAHPKVSNRDIDRTVLFELAFENLGFYMTAVEGQLRLTPEEKTAFNDIARLANERRRAVLFRESHFVLSFSSMQKDFEIPGQKLRTATTYEDPLADVKVNLNIIQNPKEDLDLTKSVQLMIHEFAHKTDHSYKSYVDTLAAKVASALKNSSARYEIEPGFSIYILGLTSPYINIYNYLRKKGTDDSKLLTEVYLYTLMYPGAEVTMLEERQTNIKQRREIGGYLMNPIGFANVPQGASSPLVPLSLSAVQNITQEKIGERFPIIKLSLYTHQELVEYNGSTVTSPKVVKNDLARQMAANTIYHELVIYTDRSGIKKISKREFKQQYAPQSAKIDRFEFKNGFLEGDGSLNLEASEFAYLLKNKLSLNILLKFKDSQTIIPAEITNTNEKFGFKFSAKVNPAVDTLMIDQIEMGFYQGGRYRRLIIPIDEARKINLTPIQKNEFKLVAWKLIDYEGERFLHTGPQSSPTAVTDPDNNNAHFNLTFLFKSDTPIREIVISHRRGDQIHKEDGLVKFSRLVEETERIQAEYFVQEKVGPYYKVFIDMGMTLTPHVMNQANDGLPKQVAISPENRIVISKMRAINQNLQVIGTDDPISYTILNPPWPKKGNRSNKCRDRFL